jgi:hypothetical protein
MMKREGSEAGTTYGPNDGRSLFGCVFFGSFFYPLWSHVGAKKEGGECGKNSSSSNQPMTPEWIFVVSFVLAS